MASFNTSNIAADRTPSQDRPIYFGYRSALEIARAVEPLNSTPAQDASNRPPEKIPLRKNFQLALKHLEAAYPNLEITRPAHTLVRGHVGIRADKERTLHSCNIDLTAGAYRRINTLDAIENDEASSAIYLSAPPLAFVQAATQTKDLIELLQLGFEICGTYQTEQTARSWCSNVAPLTNKHAISTFADHNPGLNGIKRVRQALPYLSDASASPYETKLALLLGLPKKYGGYGLGMPIMNHRVDLSKKARTIAGRAFLLCDLCWPRARLDVEYQSELIHANSVNLERDSRRQTALESMGWNVVAVTKGMIHTLEDMDAIASIIDKHLALCRHADPSNYRDRQKNLRKQLKLRLWG